MYNDEKTIFGCFGFIVWIVVIFVVSALMSGWALSQLWGWFILPVFENAPIISVGQAIGISMVTSFFTNRGTNNTKSSDDKSFNEMMYTSLAWSIARPLITVILGWIVASFL